MKMEWQPIDTAEHEIGLLLWEPLWWKGEPQNGLLVIGYYDTDLSEWRNYDGIEINPTHWMPMPEAPK
jgi:hypothetical protein